MRRLLTLVLLPGLLAFGIVLAPTSAVASERRVPTVAREVTVSVPGTKTISLQGGAQFVAPYWRGNPNAQVTLAFSYDGTLFGAPLDAGRDEVGLQRRNGTTYGAIHDARGALAVRVVTDRPLASVTILRMSDGAATTQSTMSAQSAQSAQAATTQPLVEPRSGWGADPQYMTWAPKFSPARKLIVHHTDSMNDYADKAGAQAQIRIIYYYHSVTQEWGDIGYNFIIDKFGNVYEGRYSDDYNGANPTGDDVGGNGVTGAHTDGWNSGTVGIALLGTFEGQDVTPAARLALESLLAWGASRSGIDPQASTPFVNPVSGASITSPNIASHRSYNTTTCPGDVFKLTLPTIRADVAARITTSVTSAAVIFSPLDLTSDARSDVMRVTSTGDLYLYRGNGLGGFAGSGAKIGSGWGMFVKVFSPGDFNGDGRSDILAITPLGDLYLYRGNGLGGFAGSGTKIGAGWSMFVKVLSPGDFNGDRKSDVLAVKRNGDLYLYRGNGLGGFAGSGTKIGAGWGMFVTVFSPRDFNGDGRSDILAVARSGDLYLYRGNGLGGFAGSGTKIGAGWGIFVTVFSPGDFNGDRRSDILAVTPIGDLYLYRGYGLGGFASGIKIGTGWR
jgi:N-acetylmuramoyl-L-alanine amidase/FG-GAP-like repeat